MGSLCSKQQDDDDPLYHISENKEDDDHDDDKEIIEEMIVKQGTEQHDDMFKSYAEIAAKESNRRATQIDSNIDIFQRNDIKSLPNVEGSFGRIDNEESGEYIITYWSRTQFDEILFIPLVICDLIIKFIDMVYQSRWSNKYKGPDFKINVINKCKASITSKYGPIQGIRAVNCCLRSKVSVFYINIVNYSYNMDTNRNFFGICSEYEESFNLPVPNEGYGIFMEPNWIYKGNENIEIKGKPKITNNDVVKCVVDLRDEMYVFKCLWSTTETVIKLPQPSDHEKYKDIKWYPFISGNFADMTCIISFDTFDTINDVTSLSPHQPP